MATGTGRGHKELTRLGTSAVAAVVTVVVLGAAGVRAHHATPAGPKAAARTTTTATTVPSTLRSTTTGTRPRATSTTRPRPATPTTVAPAAPRRRSVRPTTTTTTTSPAQGRQARETCLARADANHYRVVAANETWLAQQLRVLAARHQLAGPRAKALQIEEAEARTEIAAQYAIDQSNCYIDAAP